MSNHDPEAKVQSPPAAAATANNSPYPHVYPNYPYVYCKDSSDKRRTVWLVPMVVVAEIVFFVIVMFENNCPKNYDGGSIFAQRHRCVARFLGRLSFQPWKENPLLGPSTATLIKVGALHWWRVVHGGQAWRLFSAIWLHAGLIHLFVNLLSVIFIGIRLEQQFSFLRVGIIYVLSGFGGSVLTCIFLQGNASIAAVFTLAVVGAINAALGILPHVGNFSNIGGFAMGFFLGFILLIQPHYNWSERGHGTARNRIMSKNRPYQYILWLVALILLIGGLTIGLVMLFKGKDGNKHCSWCHYLICVPTSKWKCDA
ncbi:hypothetical protein CRG98_014276 [Punica granatum]|uniref:RHOMBOID-like protein n=1 Tax=Punica granatum TaxID=22663 RepID=A0A2I0K9U1_PUNGR|nr:hypothetical protein CRG98_014276 [Punica granatum]